MQRSFGQEPQVVFLMPLLEGLDGVKKMSKSYDNYIGIEEPPKEQFGKVMSIPDDLILRYYKLCLGYDEEFLRRVERRVESGENPMEIKLDLAEEIVRLYHSEAKVKKAREEFLKVFSRNEEPEDIGEFHVKKGEKIWIVELLYKAGLVNSMGDARRLIKQGALKIHGEKVSDYTLNISFEKETFLRLGRRRFLKVIPTK